MSAIIKPQAGEVYSFQDFSGMDMSEIDLTDTQFLYCNLTDAKFVGSVLTNVLMCFCRAERADFAFAALDDFCALSTDFTGADFYRIRSKRLELVSSTLNMSHFREVIIDRLTTADCIFRDSFFNESRIAGTATGCSFIDTIWTHAQASIDFFECTGNGAQIKSFTIDDFLMTYTAKHVFLDGKKFAVEAFETMVEYKLDERFNAWFKRISDSIRHLPFRQPAIPFA